mmetsp:Transcript_4415/g.7711  ORF Transcript_4415/g.7711 Transcript_4415/m.7711 type:complete len:224 (+) Transcript_4415:273-944(+)
MVRLGGGRGPYQDQKLGRWAAEDCKYCHEDDSTSPQEHSWGPGTPAPWRTERTRTFEQIKRDRTLRSRPSQCSFSSHTCSSRPNRCSSNNNSSCQLRLCHTTALGIILVLLPIPRMVIGRRKERRAHNRTLPSQLSLGQWWRLLSTTSSRMLRSWSPNLMSPLKTNDRGADLDKSPTKEFLPEIPFSYVPTNRLLRCAHGVKIDLGSNFLWGCFVKTLVFFAG